MARPKSSTVSRRNNILAVRQNNADVMRITNIIQFVLSTIVTGLSYTKLSLNYILNNIIPPSSSAFYKAQKKVVQVIVDFARESCAHAREHMLKNTIVAVDGAWDHIRNGSHCLIQWTSINKTYKKVLDYEIVIRSNKQLAGNYSGQPNLMEGVGLTRLLQRWVGCKSIKKYVHDGDVKHDSIVRSVFSNIIERRDPGHYVKNIKKMFLTKPYSELSLLSKRLMRFLKYLLHEGKYTIAQKKELWLNVPNHYCGDHSHCINGANCTGYLWKHRFNKSKVAILKQFVKKTVEIFEQVEIKLASQICESINNAKVVFASKRVNWQGSWSARASMAVLNYNESPFGVIMVLRTRLHLPAMPEVICRQFRMYFNTADAKILFNRSIPEIENHAKARALKRKENAPDDERNPLRHK